MPVLLGFRVEQGLLEGSWGAPAAPLGLSSSLRSSGANSSPVRDGTCSTFLLCLPPEGQNQSLVPENGIFVPLLLPSSLPGVCARGCCQDLHSEVFGVCVLPLGVQLLISCRKGMLTGIWLPLISATKSMQTLLAIDF